MRGVLVVVSVVAVAGLATACQDDSNTGPLPPASTAQAAPSPTDGASAAAAQLAIPDFSGDLPVDLVVGLRMLGLGCRPTTPHDACSADGLRTYSWAGPKSKVGITTARMRPEPGHGAWVVTLRFDADDRSSVTAAVTRAGDVGGYALLLDPHTGDALGAVQPAQVQGGRVVIENLSKPDAWDLVSNYVTAATQR
jgi:hypothetical protein